MVRRSLRSQKAFEKALTKELEKQAQRLMQSVLKDFSSHLEGEAQKVLKASLGGGVGGDKQAEGSFFSTAGWQSGVGNLAALGVNYLFHRPRKRTETHETSRSQMAEQSFRLSQSQAWADAQRALAKGQKNQ